MLVFITEDRHAYCNLQMDYFIFATVNLNKGRFVNAKEDVLNILLFPLNSIIVY